MRYSIALNRQLDTGTQLNALGHVSVGLAHLAPSSAQAMRPFQDAEQRAVGLMSDHPLIVLEGANSRKLQAAYLGALEEGLICNAFVLDMKDGAPIDQEAIVRTKTPETLIFVAIGCWGECDALRGVMKRFSLYR